MHMQRFILVLLYETQCRINLSFPFKLFFFSGFSFISFPFSFSPVICVALPIPKIDSNQRPFNLLQWRPEMQCGMG